ncbi:hypothetical protein H1C71_015600 [Ictidomys tridecemlineatus]|nr:hypothetical protein H1C71_015600 [Ictidomys tridecemlineatus]
MGQELSEASSPLCLHSPPSDCVKGEVPGAEAEARGQGDPEEEGSLQQSCRWQREQKARRDSAGAASQGEPHVLQRLRPGLLSLGMTGIWGRAVLWCGGWSLHYRMFQRLQPLCTRPLAIPEQMSTKTFRPQQRSPLGAKLPTGETHWPAACSERVDTGCRSRAGQRSCESLGRAQGVRVGLGEDGGAWGMAFSRVEAGVQQKERTSRLEAGAGVGPENLALEWVATVGSRQPRYRDRRLQPLCSGRGSPASPSSVVAGPCSQLDR